MTDTFMTQHITLVEVGPRDGLQNEKQVIDVETKVALIERLADAGFKNVEGGAFVSPKWVPQMAASDEVMQTIKRLEGVSYPVLTPNMKGYEGARSVNADTVAVFGAASESFSQKNINCSIEESLARFKPVIDAAKADGVRVRGYVSCVLGCPYEGAIAPNAVAPVAAALYEMGCYEISLGDTIGVGTPEETRALIRTVAKAVPINALAGHFHDTYGQALANIWAAIDEGVRVFDASVSGLGGCPYAKGASGNVASE
ncbi:MAG: hydroxymethylglutaryl-CoA lyase, partial [Pseudomonadota bacterium]